jgi:SAM-dependent methyltransferase
MNFYRMLKNLDAALKEWPKIKASVKTLQDRSRSAEKLLKKRGVNHHPWHDKWSAYHLPAGLATAPTRSSLCKQSDFLQEHHLQWCKVMKVEPEFHRKQWEFVYILESLKQRGMIAPGKRGLGFAVGTEPIPSVLCAGGCEVVATDIQPEIGTAKGWTNLNQLCFGLDDLNQRGICSMDAFRRLCSYRPVDMNVIPDDLQGFDFNWSSCSFEHLGSIQKGLDFLKNQLKTLKPGGWAIHTTEYNISSNDETLEEENCVIFRQRDIEKVVAELRADGHFVEELDYSLGWLPYDYKVDVPPYDLTPHLRLQLSKYICTSIGLIIRKNPEASA